MSGDTKLPKPNPPHFNISSSVVHQLGKELVTDEVTAIMELVKNSYDADAKRVIIEINTQDVLTLEGLFFPSERKGYIIIDDNGFGMNLGDIIDGWLVISLSNKRSMKALLQTTPAGRIPLGEKGLGRLSTQKLSDRLEMFTGKKGDSGNYHVAFSWDDFVTDKPITEIEPYLVEIPKPITTEGTKIILTNLSNLKTWEDKGLNKFKGQLSQLIFPIKERRPFQVYLKVNNQNYDLDELNDNVRNTAISNFKFDFDDKKLTISGFIKFNRLSGNQLAEIQESLEKLVTSDNGKEFYSFLIDRKVNNKYSLKDITYIGTGGKLFQFEHIIQLADVPELSYSITDDEGKEQKQFNNPGKFSGEIDEYFFNEDVNLGGAFDSYSELRTIVQNQAGVRIYRDGFGIKPYGMGKDDWLDLSGGQTTGASFYGMRPKNVIGYVEITSKFNSALKEKTDREGFMEDEFSLNFFALMGRVTKDINNVLLRTRRSFNEFRATKAQQIGNFTSVNDSLNTIIEAANTEAALVEEAVVLQDQVSVMTEQITQQSVMLNTLPESADKAKVKEAIRQIEKILQESNTLLSTVQGMLGKSSSLKNVVEYLKPKIDIIQKQANDFAELASIGLVGEVLSHELAHITRGLEERSAKVYKELRLPNPDLKSMIAFVDYIQTTAISFKKQLSHLSPVLSYVREKRSNINVKSFLTGLTEYYQQVLAQNKITIQINTKADFDINCSEGRLTQVLDNLVFNAEYWLKQYKNIHAEDERRATPLVTLEIAAPLIKVYDNGLGIDPGLEDAIFQPFVTAKPDGRGLGLYICQQLLETEGCNISLGFERNASGRRFIFIIDLSNIIIQ